MKKRLFAILLVVALVFSTVAVLVACDNDSGYTITFKNNGRTLFELKTKDNKISKSDVQAKETEFYRQLHSRDAEGYLFKGWFATVGADDDGETVYSDEINYARKYTADAEYHAGYEFLPTSGEENGYTLIGVIGNVADWGVDGQGAGTTHPEWILEQDTAEPWVYSISGVELLPGDNFKLKTYDMGWDEGKVNYGYDNIGELALADGVVADLQNHELRGDLFYGNRDGNVAVSQWVASATIDVTLNYRAKKFDISVTQISLREELPDDEYILVGDFPEGSWEMMTQQSTLILEATGQPGIYTISHDFTTDLKFRIKLNVANWDTCFGYTHIKSIVGEGSIVAPLDLFTVADDNNMICNYDCTLTITLNANTGALDILITKIADDTTIFWESDGYVLVGAFADASWVKPSSNPKYLFDQDDENLNIGTLNIDLVAGDSFKVATNIANWDAGRINAGYDKLVAVVDKDGKTVENLFTEGENQNIVARANCNVTITLNVRTKNISVLVNSNETIPDLTFDPDMRQWGFTGVNGNWNTDVDLTTQDDGHHVLNGYRFTQSTTFKFRPEGQWNNNGEVGWNNDRVQIVAGEGVEASDIVGLFQEGPSDSNLQVNKACTVNIDLYYVNATMWTLIITVVSVG